MNIDDILAESKGANLGLELYNRMEKLGGSHLMERFKTVFECKEDARDWFYSKNYSLDFKRPYDLCLEKKVENVHNALDAYIRTEQGILS